MVRMVEKTITMKSLLEAGVNFTAVEEFADTYGTTVSSNTLYSDLRDLADNGSTKAAKRIEWLASKGFLVVAKNENFDVNKPMRLTFDEYVHLETNQGMIVGAVRDLDGIWDICIHEIDGTSTTDCVNDLENV